MIYSLLYHSRLQLRSKDSIDETNLLINRVLNPEWANGWAIVKASDHKAVWKGCRHRCKGFGNDVAVIPVLTYGEYLAVHKELA